MKRLLALLTLSLISSGITAMQKEPIKHKVVITKSEQEKTITIIAADGSAHTLPEKHAKASETIKYQMEDSSGGEIYLPYIKDKKHFDLISLFLGFAEEIQEFDQQCDAQELSQDNKVILRRELYEDLKNRSLKDLHQLILACNYLDIPIILNAAIDELAQRLGKKEAVNECLMKGYYEIAPNEKLDFDINMAHAVAQRMLKKYAAKEWLAMTKSTHNKQSLPKKVMLPLRSVLQPGGTHCFNEKRSLVARALMNNQIAIYDLNGNQIGKNLVGHTDGIRTLQFNSDGTLLASSSNRDQTLRIWDVKQGTQLCSFNHTLWIPETNYISFSPDSRYVCYSAGDGRIAILDLQKNEIIKQIQTNNHLSSACFSTNGKMLYILGYYYLKIIETKDFNEVYKEFQFDTNFTHAACSTDNKTLALVSYDKIILYDCATKQARGKPIYCDSDCNHRKICFNQNGTVLAIHSRDIVNSTNMNHYIELWDITTDTPYQICKTKVDSRDPSTFVFGENDSTLIACCDNGVHIYSLEDVSILQKTIKTPEHAALLLSAYDCARQGAEFTTKKYPGINSMAIPA